MGWVSYLHRAATTNYLCCGQALEGSLGAGRIGLTHTACKGSTNFLTHKICITIFFARHKKKKYLKKYKYNEIYYYFCADLINKIKATRLISTADGFGFCRSCFAEISYYFFVIDKKTKQYKQPNY